MRKFEWAYWAGLLTACFVSIGIETTYAIWPNQLIDLANEYTSIALSFRMAACLIVLVAVGSAMVYCYLKF